MPQQRRAIALGQVGITEPVPRPLQKLLRQAVLDHLATETRRVHPPVLHVGVPGRVARELTIEPGDRLDHALCTDMVEAMLRPSLERKVVPLLWVTRRSRVDDVIDADRLWSSATRSAGGELGLRLDLVVVTRTGWHDPASGVKRTWKRLRPTP